MLQNAGSPLDSSTQEVPSKQVALVPSLSNFAKTIRDENAAIHAAVAAAMRDVLPVLSLGRAARAAKRQLPKRQFGNWERRECKVSWRHGLGAVINRTADQVRYLYRKGAFGDAVKKVGHRTMAGDLRKLKHFPNLINTDDAA